MNRIYGSFSEPDISGVRPGVNLFFEAIQSK